MLGFETFARMTSWLASKENTIVLFQTPFRSPIKGDKYVAYSALFENGVLSTELADLVLQSDDVSAKVAFVRHGPDFIVKDKMTQWWAVSTKVRVQMLTRMVEEKFDDKLMIRALLDNHGSVRSAAIERFLTRASNEMLVTAFSAKNRKGNPIQLPDLVWADPVAALVTFDDNPNSGFRKTQTIFEPEVIEPSYDIGEQYTEPEWVSAPHVAVVTKVTSLASDILWGSILTDSASKYVRAAAFKNVNKDLLITSLASHLVKLDMLPTYKLRSSQDLDAAFLVVYDMAAMIANSHFPSQVRSTLVDARYAKTNAWYAQTPSAARAGLAVLSGTSIEKALSVALNIEPETVIIANEPVVKNATDLTLKEAIQATRSGIAFPDVNADVLPQPYHLASLLHDAPDETIREIVALVNDEMDNAVHVDDKLEMLADRLCSQPYHQIRFRAVCGLLEKESFSSKTNAVLVNAFADDTVDSDWLFELLGDKKALDVVAENTCNPLRGYLQTYDRERLTKVFNEHGISFEDTLEAVTKHIENTRSR